MRGQASREELAALGTQPTTVISLHDALSESNTEAGVVVNGGVSTRDKPAEADGAQDGGGVSSSSERGYSSVFHFTSEDIWNRIPVTIENDRE